MKKHIWLTIKIIKERLLYANEFENNRYRHVLVKKCFKKLAGQEIYNIANFVLKDRQKRTNAFHQMAMSYM